MARGRWSKRGSSPVEEEDDLEDWRSAQNVQAEKLALGGDPKKTAFYGKTVKGKRGITRHPYRVSEEVEYEEETGKPVKLRSGTKVGIRGGFIHPEHHEDIDINRPAFRRKKGESEDAYVTRLRESEHDIPTDVRHRLEWSDYEKQSWYNIEKYKDAFGELLRSPLPGAVWRWENPDGTKTPRSSDIWASDSGFFFASEQAQKTSKKNVPQDVFAMSNILAKGNPGLADQVVKCRVCQRESYYLYPKTMYDEEGFMTEQPSAQQKVCRDCQHKGIVQEHSRKTTRGIQKRKGESNKAFMKRKQKMKSKGYRWNITSLHSKIRPFNQTVLSDNHAPIYNLGWDGEVDRENGKIVRSERVSRFLQGIFDF